MDQSRRVFLKRSAVAGGIVWAAPVITSLPGIATPAAGTPDTGCVADCTGGGRALFVDPPILGSFQFGVDADEANTDAAGFDSCVADPNAVIAGATVICGDFSDDDGVCTARSRVAGVNTISPPFPIEVSFTALSSEASATDTGCGTGSSNVANLTVEGTPVVNVTSSENATHTATVDGFNVTVVVNEQVCENDEFVVRALHITAVDPITNDVSELIVAESRAGNAACCPNCTSS